MSSNPTQTVRWGILGCGDVTEVKSGPALQKVARSNLVSVMRRDAEKAADYASRHKVPHWTNDADALISDPDLTALYIATPPDTHADYAIRALQAGKNVLLEKPMALNGRECDAIEAAVRETDGKLCVAYYRRALPRFEKLRQIITDGSIGSLRLIEVRHFMCSDDRPDQIWKIDPTVGGGGCFVDMQSHTLDWLTYVFGMPVAVKGLKKRQGNQYQAEDLVSYLMDFGGFPTVGMCAYATAERQESVTIHGDKGSASMSFFKPTAVALTVDGVEQQIEISDPPHVHQPFIERVVAHFLDDAPNPCSAQDGRRSADLVEEIFKGL
ncbi:Gfo/Idh/MocA family protein [Cohaesibacter celericrescens]|uniref:Gfo/Idh/MocA family protein n=1 Tax=Cohaesibacter celericrescens TaxID=2067669 RepID=UPI00356A9CEC